MMIEEATMEKEKRFYRTAMIVGGIFLFCMTFYFSRHLQMDYAPDEYMRILVSKYIYNHNRLPLGTESEIRNEIWGFSYGFTPYLPSLFAALNMKIVSLFTTSESALLTAARFENVCALTIMWFLAGKVGCRLFKTKTAAFLLAVMVCFLPQVVFIASYHNNDMFGLMCTVWIALGWLWGDQDGWNGKNSVFLGIGIGILALTYYNDYGWILCSLIFYLISAHRQELGWKKILKYAMIVCVVAFAIAGWFFIRNYMIHDGDFLGMNTMYAEGEKYAWDQYKPSLRDTPEHAGLTFSQAFIKMHWFSITWESVIGFFGYMEFNMSSQFYGFFTAMLLIMVIVSIVEVCRRRDISINLTLNFIACMIIPVGLSMYYSYFVDFEPQGRYIISLVLPMMYFCVYGVDSITDRMVVKERKGKYLLVGGIIILYLCLSLYCLKTGMVGHCF